MPNYPLTGRKCPNRGAGRCSSPPDLSRCEKSNGTKSASADHAKATTATIRTQLINVPARLARSARRLTMHLPQDWPWEPALTRLYNTAAPAPPALT
jgi:hypothetical protein